MSLTRLLSSGSSRRTAGGRVRRASLRFLVAALLAGGLTHAAAAQSVAVVNLRAAMEATSHWKNAWAGLTKDRDRRQKALEPKQKALANKAKQLEAQRAVSSPAAVAPQVQKLMQDRQALEQSFLKDQRELTLREKKLTDQMLQRMQLVIRELASSKGYDYVFELNSVSGPNVLYHKAGLDVTKAVSALYKKRFGKTPLK